MKSCNKCSTIHWEDWPKGACAARCMNEYRPKSGIQPYGRVLEVFPHGRKGRVISPAWCPNNGERRKE